MKNNPPFFLLPSLPPSSLYLSSVHSGIFLLFYTFRSMNNSPQIPTKIHALQNVTHLSNPVIRASCRCAPHRVSTHIPFSVFSWHLAQILEHPYPLNHSHLQSYLLAVLPCVGLYLHFMLSFLTPRPLSSFQGKESEFP